MKIETKTQIMAPPRSSLDPAGIAAKRTIMSNKFLPTLPILGSGLL
jgi:hypothetical protein